MDALPIALTGVCERVDTVSRARAGRAHSACPSRRRRGLTRDEFMEKVKDGSVRHVGLAESISMIADALAGSSTR